MKKMAGPLVLVLMLVLCIGSWKNIFAANGKEDRTYQSYLQQAEHYEEKKIYIDAIAFYQSAQKMQPDNLELTYKIADLYQKLGEEENYLEQLRKAYSKNPEDLDSCKILIEAALEEKEYQTAYDDVQTALQQENCTDEWKATMESYLLQLRAVVQYQKYLSVSEIKPYAYPTDAIASAVVKIDGKYGVVNADNELILDAEYEDAGNLGGGFFPVCQDGEYCYVDTDAYRRRVPDFAVAWLGSFAEGYAPFQMAEKNEKSDAYPEEIPKDELGKYGYLDTDMKAYAVEYNYAGMFSNGCAAVEKDGKWMLIDKEMKQVGKETFEEILVDENGYSTRYGVFWGKKDGKFYLYDLSGKQLSDTGYTAVKPFASQEPCAVQMDNGKWGFVSVKGEQELEGTYPDAKSYSCGYAPVQEADGWTLIDTDSNVMLEDTYDEMSVVYADDSFVTVKDVSDGTEETDEQTKEDLLDLRVLAHTWMYPYQD